MERKKEKDNKTFDERDLETAKTRKNLDPQESCEIEEKSERNT
jgi:hypothetical protein